MWPKRITWVVLRAVQRKSSDLGVFHFCTHVLRFMILELTMITLRIENFLQNAGTNPIFKIGFCLEKRSCRFSTCSSIYATDFTKNNRIFQKLLCAKKIRRALKEDKAPIMPLRLILNQTNEDKRQEFMRKQKKNEERLRKKKEEQEAERLRKNKEKEEKRLKVKVCIINFFWFSFSKNWRKKWQFSF